MHVFEGLYGTSRSSYLKLENAKMIVRHSAKIDENKIGARSRCIESIFIENDNGERFLFPGRQLAPARAMTQHINHDGSFADEVGLQIIRMADDFRNLGACARYINDNSDHMNESAGAIRESCRSKISEMRKVFEKMYRPAGYVAEAKKILERASTLNESDDTDAVPAEKIEEMRNILTVEGADISDAIIESVCRCVPDIQMEDVLADPLKNKTKNGFFKKTVDENTDVAVADSDEEEKPVTKKIKGVMILGYEVPVVVWNNFKKGELEFEQPPVVRDKNGNIDVPQFLNKDAELRVRLADIIPFVKDNYMGNLLSRISDYLDNNNLTAQDKQIVRAIARTATKIANAAIDSGLPTKSRAVKEFSQWLGKFSVNKLMENDEMIDHGETALDYFTSEEFFKSDAVSRMLHGRHPDAPVSRFDVETALRGFLRFLMITHDVSGDMSRMSNELYDDAAQAFVDNGFTVIDSAVGTGEDNYSNHMLYDSMIDEDDMNMVDDGMIDEDDMNMVDDGMTNEITDECDTRMMEDDELTREDILFPSDNVGDNLGREVMATTVTDPETGDEQLPDGGYVNRLQTLAGLRSGL